MACLGLGSSADGACGRAMHCHRSCSSGGGRSPSADQGGRWRPAPTGRRPVPDPSIRKWHDHSAQSREGRYHKAQKPTGHVLFGHRAGDQLWQEHGRSDASLRWCARPVLGIFALQSGHLASDLLWTSTVKRQASTICLRHPPIAKVDKYLASWQALLLSTTGRVVLINAVLSGVPTYAMGMMLLPPGVTAAIDARRRAFLWTGSENASGARCLVAWESVCRAKEDGGLGIRRLDTQNACLLLKLVHRFHHPQGSAWAHWVRDQINLSNLGGELARTHWAALRNLLPAYQRITTVSVGNGTDTTFWHNTWLLDGPLAQKMPGRRGSQPPPATPHCPGCRRAATTQLTPRWRQPRWHSAPAHKLLPRWKWQTDVQRHLPGINERRTAMPLLQICLVQLCSAKG